MREAVTEVRLKRIISQSNGENRDSSEECKDDRNVGGIHLPIDQRAGQTRMAACAVAMDRLMQGVADGEERCEKKQARQQASKRCLYRAAGTRCLVFQLHL